MILFKTYKDLHAHLETLHARNRRTGFVPTMGALHQGHLSLIEQSRQQTEVTISSIFVNPTQFNDLSDFQKYPVTIENDIALLETAGTDILFLPEVKEIYPEGIAHLPHYRLGYLETILEGKYRPGHFQGVCQVMHRLLDLVRPAHLFMGRKDYQQCMVVARLLQLMKMSTVLHPCPTLREPDGLAMSSRNTRLTPAERERSVTIYKTLQMIAAGLLPGDTATILLQAKAMLEQEQFRVDYVELADAQTLLPAEQWDGQSPLVALIAAFLGDVRLIDNMPIPIFTTFVHPNK